MKGSHKEIAIDLTHELNGQKWQNIPEAINKVKIVFKYNFGRPFLAVMLPEGWAEGRPEDVSPLDGAIFAHYTGQGE